MRSVRAAPPLWSASKISCISADLARGVAVGLGHLRQAATCLEVGLERIGVLLQVALVGLGCAARAPAFSCSSAACHSARGQLGVLAGRGQALELAGGLRPSWPFSR